MRLIFPICPGIYSSAFRDGASCWAALAVIQKIFLKPIRYHRNISRNEALIRWIKLAQEKYTSGHCKDLLVRYGERAKMGKI